MKNNSRILALVGLLSFAVLTATQSQAVTLIGNLNTSTSQGGIIIAANDAAAGFTMPGQDYTLTNAVLRLANYAGPTDAVVALYSDTLGFPGTALATLVDPAGGAEGDFTFMAPAGPPVTLLANTSYWLVLESEPAQSYTWREVNAVPSGVATFNGYAQGSVGVAWFTIDGTLGFAINGEPVTPAVPDTGSTIMLLGIGLLTLALLSRRQSAVV